MASWSLLSCHLIHAGLPTAACVPSLRLVSKLSKFLLWFRNPCLVPYVYLASMSRLCLANPYFMVGSDARYEAFLLCDSPTLWDYFTLRACTGWYYHGERTGLMGLMTLKELLDSISKEEVTPPSIRYHSLGQE